MSKPKIALLGTGIMGSGMARRLLGAGLPLVVFNRSRDKAAPLAADGAEIADSPRAAAARAEVVIGMVADDQASRAVWMADDGALAAIARGSVAIESSTVTVGWVRELARAADARGVEFLDAPVTGSRPQAAAGQLNFLVGGGDPTLERVRPVLAAMGRSITLLGPSGSGAMMKLVNNFVCGVEVGALVEAIGMIERSGLDRAKALEVLTEGAPGSPLLKTVAGRIAAGDFTPQFLLRLMAKDLAYARHEAAGLALELVTARAAEGLFQQGVAAGLGEEDMSALVKALRAGGERR